MISENADKAMFHFYLVTEILKQIPEEYDLGVGDIFGYGEDCFVLDLYPYSECFYHEYYKMINSGKKYTSLSLFEIVSDLAKRFWLLVKNKGFQPLDAKIPSKVEFKLIIKQSLEKN